MNCRIKSQLCTIGALALVCWSMQIPCAPLEVYGRLPNVEDVSLSPDGSRIAFVNTEGDNRTVAVMSLADRKTIGAVNVGATKLRGTYWVDNDHLALTVSSTAMLRGAGWQDLGEYLQLMIYDIPKQRVRNPLDLGDGLVRHSGPTSANVIASAPIVRLVDGRAFIFVTGFVISDGFIPALFEIDPDTTTPQLLNKGLESVGTDWLVDEHGEVAVERVYHNHAGDQRWAFRLRADGQLRETVSGHEGVDVPEMVGFAPDYTSVWVRLLENGSPVVRPLLLKQGRFGDPIEKASTFNDFMVDRATGRVIGGTVTSGRTALEFLDPHWQSQWLGVVGSFRGDVITFVSAADDFSRLVIKLEGPRDLVKFMLIDLKTNTATSLGLSYKGLDVYAEQRSISYPAGDGLSIQAFLTMPPNRPAKNLPLVVLPHGGPHDHDEPGFDFWAQALAAQGYAVLQPNFRGSDLNQALLVAGYGQWGRKMQSDLSDGVRYLAASGIVDAKRVCIDGASYGGYAALAAVTLEPGVYRCAIAVAGISDLKEHFADALGGLNHEEGTYDRYFERYIGVHDLKDPALGAISPALHVDAITVPVLLIHGHDDTVVPFKQSQIMFKAMKKAGKVVELVELKREDHWLSHGETRLQMLAATVAFLKAHNPPD